MCRVREAFPRARWPEGVPVHYRPHPLDLESTRLTEWLGRFPANDSLRREDIAREAHAPLDMTTRAWSFYLRSYLERVLEDPADMEFAVSDILSSLRYDGKLGGLTGAQIDVLREFVTRAKELDAAIWDDEVAQALAAIDAELERRTRPPGP